MVIRCSKERAFIKVRMILDLDTAYKVLSSGNSNVIKVEDHTKVAFTIHRSKIEIDIFFKANINKSRVIFHIHKYHVVFFRYDGLLKANKIFGDHFSGNDMHVCKQVNLK